MYSRIEFKIYALFSFVWLFLDISAASIRKTFFPSRVENFTDDDCCLSNKIVVVTGANTGIGKATSTALAKRGATVVLACRDVQRGMEAANEINNILKSTSRSSSDFPYACNGKAQFMRLDLSDLSTVLDFTTRICEQFESVDILINNAGLNGDAVLSNGIQSCHQVNYLGHYLLTRALIAKLKGVKRIVNLSSVMHHLGQADYRLSSRSSGPGHSCYCDSKLYMNLLTCELNKPINFSDGVRVHEEAGHETPRTPILALSVNPGAVRSDIWRNFPFQKFFQGFMKIVFLEVEEGAATSIYGATVSTERVLAGMHQAAQAHGGKGLIVAEQGGQMIAHPLIPYIIPYHMPIHWLPFEMAGTFCGPRFSVTSIPSLPCTISSTPGVRIETVSQLARDIWQFSGELCKELLTTANVDPKTFDFLG